ncbi:uncharacterized protein PV09_05475 [Verruconis gallopava]|uniref:Major facilitator superfamily (MFS) profile domain-containing protein n=1 Tax=Verruconis gallopava TaxID=253628 RepID=A0A0D2AVR5_9PEZI|nr:uncharacterized protein PV09_05475 [Verruconis gallopava]KIW03254.1 hypothetical protein PV09_05475 [Verruconis gallopava]
MVLSIMSDKREIRAGEELGDSANDVHDRGDFEKYEVARPDNVDFPDHISEMSSAADNAPLSRQVSLARTKSRRSNVMTKVASRLTTHSIKDPGPPPDGGFRAWLQCFCGWLAICNTWGFALSFGAFQTYFAETLPESPSTISWIGSTQACLIFLVGAFSGRALDAGLFRPTVFIGILIQLFGIFTMSVSKHYWQLLITQGILTGIGGGLFFCPAMGLMSTYFLKKRGMALGIATTGNSAGGMIYPVIVRQLLPKIGFGWTVRVLGLLNFVTLAFCVVFMKPRLPPRKSGPIVEWTAVKDVPYVLFVVGCCFLMAPIYFSFFYIASFARDVVGLPYTQSLNLVIILNGIGIPARILPGFIADRFAGPLNVFIPIITVNFVLLWAWLGVRNVGGFYAFTVVYGIFAAGFQSLFPTCVGSLSTDLSKAGTRLGMAFSTISFAALVGGPIGGAILQADHRSYRGPIIWAATSTMIGTAMVAGSRVSKKGWKLNVRC